MHDSNQKLRQIADNLLHHLDITISELPQQMNRDDSTIVGFDEEALRYMIQLFCKMVDQALFYLVSWARRIHFFRELTVGLAFNSLMFIA